VSIVLLGVVGVAVLVAASTAVTGARTNDQIAATQASLAEAADYLTDLEPENVTYQSCVAPNNPLATYQTALNAQFGAGSVLVVQVLFWDRTPETFGATCRYSAGDRLQQVRLRSVTNGSTREVDVIKRPVPAPTIDTVPAPPAPPYAGGSGQADVSLTPNMP
jgi:type II secretory pathway pseudopilin PulG